MENIEVRVTEDKKLILTVDLTCEGDFTRRACSRRVATSGGNIVIWKDGQPLPGPIKFNLNVTRGLTATEREEAKRTREKAW